MTTKFTAWARRLGCCALAFAFLLPARPAAGQTCGSAPGAPTAARAEPWPAPLDRKVTLHARNLPLRDALDRVAAAARIRFSYTDELLPLDRPVCASFREVAVGDVLVRLLAGAHVSPVAAGADQVILAPALASSVEEPPPRDVVTLDRIVVTGSVSGAPQRELPVALTVIGRRALDSDASGTVSQLMDAGVPGMWLWEQSPATVVASYGSVRGASSFGLTAPKVYLDGIEIANPLLFSQLAPSAVERIEVIRGPQGTALYGADALSGVVNIVTRRGHLEPGMPHAHLQSSLGLAQSTFVNGGATTQLHALSLRTGSDLHSAGLDVAVGTIGAFMPGAYNRHVTATGGARLVGPRTILTATGRYFAQQAGVALSPVLRDALGGVATQDTTLHLDSGARPESVREYTLGGSLTFAQDARWTHSVVLGLDGYDLSGVAQQLTPVPTEADSVLKAARGAAQRGTLRLTSVGRFGDGAPFSATLTFAAEQSLLRERTAAQQAEPLEQYAASTPGPQVAQWQTTTAGVVQAQGSLANSLFLTGGLRAEQDGGLVATQSALLPMLGAALVREYGPLTVKLRTAYGRGIRPAQTPARETMLTGIQAQDMYPALQPERQSGIEAGIDLVYRSNFSLQLTRYDQVASGLIQRVSWPAAASDNRLASRAAIFFPDSGSHPGTKMPRLESGLQNVGSIGNRGWEMQASGGLGALALSGTLAYTDSHVDRIAGNYTGDLRAGNRVLGVPAWTGSLGASWNAGPWTASIAGSRAYDWIDYDRVALTRDYLGGLRTAWQLSGPALRSYWKHYDGVSHLRFSASREFNHGLSLLFTGDNLLNYQVGEPDNVTVLPGRSFTLGVRAAF